MSISRPYIKELYKGDTASISHIFSFVPESYEWRSSLESCVVGNSVQSGRRIDAQVSTESRLEALLVLKAFAADGGVEVASWRVVPIGGDNRRLFSGLEAESLQDYLETEGGEIISEDGHIE